MDRTRNYGEESPAVQAHLNIMQSVIQRMAANSAASKGWCIVLVSAILVLVADKGQPRYGLIATIPAALFLVLDAYYLALERRFRDSYNDFINKLHRGEVIASDLYAVTPAGPPVRTFFKAMGSFSVWPLYVTLLVTIAIAMAVIIPTGAQPAGA